MAVGIHAPAVTAEFLEHANEASATTNLRERQRAGAPR
jgi:hypothetical protein